ncbi:short-chain dehydrogenase, putative [Cordyceps militaris CM01]|uniref:Short-chain dehydrogenase, putative n=1 Tax=Cordyceps militaris (strain CM01) TaxID=983644 RepID=G3JKH0_CORMM|nr:short-chain dehydrogenase, putative [Cordyceps militaris CM01]EGX92248.1 short-chain dehydrogenase, putative [Cordyceps militaris CM01]
MSPVFDATTTASELVTHYAAQIKGKVILTTGVSPKGLGANFVLAIAKAQPSLLILAARNPSKADQTARDIEAASPDVKTKIVELHNDSLASARAAATTVLSWADVPSIDVLVNNAGIMASDYKLSSDKIESQFATNHVGHFLFTNLIMEKLLAAESPRVVNVSSDGHRLSHIRWDDYNFDNGKTYNRWTAYGQSKTANILFSRSLAEKLSSKGLLSHSLHPGVISTHLGDHLVEFDSLKDADRSLGNKEGWEDFKWKTPDQGAATHVFAAFEPSLKDNNGTYLENSRVADPNVETVKPWATSPVEAERLWKLSEKLVGQEFSY